MNKREIAKAERRERIARAAINLTEQSGLEGFSMRDLAREAGVSHATPFNLFGSKAEIISYIFEMDLENFRRVLFDRNAADPIDMIFNAIRIATRYFQQKQALYRALHTSFHETAADKVRQRFTAPRQKLFEDLVEAAKDAKMLRSNISTTLIARSLYHQWESVLFDWVKQSISLQRMEREVCFAISALLAGFATPKMKDRLHRSIVEYQGMIFEEDPED